MDALSTTTAMRQVAREGKRWGLVPDVVDGDVKVCEMRHSAEVRGGLGEVRRDQKFRIATVDEECPFSAVLHNRVDNGEVDLDRRYRLHDELVAAEQRRQAQETDDEIREMWRTRKRVTVGPGGLYVPAGLAERAAHAQRNRRSA